MFDENIVGVTIDIETYKVLQRCKRECEQCLELAHKLVDKYADEDEIIKAKNTVKHLEYVLGLKAPNYDENYEMRKGRYFVSSELYKDEFRNVD